MQGDSLIMVLTHDQQLPRPVSVMSAKSSLANLGPAMERSKQNCKWEESTNGVPPAMRPSSTEAGTTPSRAGLINGTIVSSFSAFHAAWTG